MGMSSSVPIFNFLSRASTKISYISWFLRWNSIFSLFILFRIYFKSETYDKSEEK